MDTQPETADLLLFEYYVLPLKQMSLCDYERRLKKLAYVDEFDYEVVTIKQLQESFSDDVFMSLHVLNEQSILMQVMTSELFQVREKKSKYELEEEYYNEENSLDRASINRETQDQSDKEPCSLLSVPKLMLLGILYTASNAKQRAERFYELVQFNLDSQIFTNDWEF